VRSVGGKRSEGIVLLRSGNPEASLHQRDDAQDRGRQALKLVWQDSYDESCVLELHARVDMDGLVREYSGAILERPAKVVKRAKIPQAVDRTDIERQLQIWKAQGYDVSSLESNLGAEPTVLTASLLVMREAVKRAEAVSAILASLDLSGFESRAEILREKLRDPIRYTDIDAELESLRVAMQKTKRIESKRKLEQSREHDFKERTKRILDRVMKQRRDQRPEAPLPSSDDVAKALEEAPAPVDSATNLATAFTFDGFTVGESNRFAHTAAMAVAKQPAKAYNPLLITSGSGLGKTHLLHAIGNYIASHEKGAKVLYLTCEAFASGLTEAREKGSLAAFRTRVRGVDCLLLDDIQFLSGMSEAHEELFHTFNDLHAAEKQIVLASDRSPKAITNLDSRLTSRFESGLVAGMERPDLATRVAILERRARDAKVTMDPELLKVIATVVEDNVRELGGALNRVVAFSSMMGRPITEGLVREVLEEPQAESPPRVTVATESPSPNPDGLVPGRSYLVEEDRPVEAFRRLTGYLAGRGDGLVISRTNPKRVREAHDLQADQVLWLTDREGSSEDTIAPALERIVYEIEGFMSKHPRGAVLLDGIEYLVSNNSFEAVLKFVRRLLDLVSESHYVLLISLSSATLKDQELKVLEREMEVIRFL
jgi:chromosomal replication initiator protein DnaA